VTITGIFSAVNRSIIIKNLIVTSIKFLRKIKSNESYMEHNIPLITTIASAFGLALIFGFIAERIKIPALVGYMIAGIMIGPTTPGFVADININYQL